MSDRIKTGSPILDKLLDTLTVEEFAHVYARPEQFESLPRLWPLAFLPPGTTFYFDLERPSGPSTGLETPEGGSDRV